MDTLSLNNEMDILREVINGSEKCFCIIYQHYSPKLYFKLLKLVKSDSLAQDILQDVFLSVWKHRAEIDVEKSFRSYLFQIVVNKTYDVYRKAARETKLKLRLKSNARTATNSPETDLNRKEDALLLSRTIDLLPVKRREIFKLCKIDGKSYHEVSEQLGISASTVSDHIVKANLFLREQLHQKKAVTVITSAG